ncbi:co-chaperone GroES [Miniphocaeibacter halophilus]|uniref:Co-chaperone GroES n=1 Tax=Miniphocaeibacter halophilus TaxID=2931922 RepID=A0AC61MT93_9FIRM|nr:co-chaperone GroES [Miniphocaeibacter halophilus]QQK07451.1 co-chaperone GroES [Miniphocaeibacter halophilus]
MILKPIGERIVVKMVEVEEKTSSGIVLPSSAKEKPQVAEVVAVSKAIENNENNIKINVGDKVIYSKYSGTEVKLDDEEYIIVKLEDVLAIVE